MCVRLERDYNRSINEKKELTVCPNVLCPAWIAFDCFEVVLPRRLRMLAWDIRRVNGAGGPSIGTATDGKTSFPVDGRGGGGSANVNVVGLCNRGVSSRGSKLDWKDLGTTVSCRGRRWGIKNARCWAAADSAVVGPGVRSSSRWRFPTTAFGSYSTAEGRGPSTSFSSSNGESLS